MKFILIAVAACCLAVVSTAPVKDDNNHQDEFDRMLMIRIHDAIKKGEERLFHLQMQINEFEKTKNAELKAQIIREIETALAMTDGVKHVIEQELKRTDLDFFEEYNFEMALKSIEVMNRDLKKEEERIKNIN